MAHPVLKLKYFKELYPILRYLRSEQIHELKVEVGTREFLESFTRHWAATDEEGKRSGEFVACGVPSWTLPAFHFKSFPWRGDSREFKMDSLLHLLVAESKSPEYIVHYRYDEDHNLYVTVYDYRDFDWETTHLEAHEEVAGEIGAMLKASVVRMESRLEEVQRKMIGRIGRTPEEKAGQLRLPYA